jgi:hypothetical protein
VDLVGTGKVRTMLENAGVKGLTGKKEATAWWKYVDDLWVRLADVWILFQTSKEGAMTYVKATCWNTQMRSWLRLRRPFGATRA